MLGSVEKGKIGISQLYFHCYIFLLYKNNRKIASKKRRWVFFKFLNEGDKIGWIIKSMADSLGQSLPSWNILIKCISELNRRKLIYHRQKLKDSKGKHVKPKQNKTMYVPQILSGGRITHILSVDWEL